MARIPLPTRETLQDEVVQKRWDRSAERGPVLNVTRMFMANPAVELNAGKLWGASTLSPRVRELAILRCAYLQQSTYEWHQHVRIAQGEGITPAEINGVRDWQSSTLFSEQEREVLAWADALAAARRPSDDQYAAFAKSRTPAEIFGITMLITEYFRLAHVMAALDLETEEPFVGWDIAK